MTCQELRQLVEEVPFEESTFEQRNALFDHGFHCLSCSKFLLELALKDLTDEDEKLVDEVVEMDLEAIRRQQENIE